MKKLMTMISAVAVAFGLQAAAPYPSGSHFNEEKWLETESETNMWTSVEGLSISTKSATFQEEVGLPAQWVDEILGNNLAFQRGLTDPTYRAIQLNEEKQPVKQTIGENGVVVDTLIKFTAYDGDDQANIENTNAKVAVWVKEIEGADGAASTYQLMVTAGKWVKENQNLVRKDYACSSKITNMDAWYRLTVKAIPDVTNGGHIPGFVVSINGETVTSDDVKKDLTGVPLSTEAAVWNLTGAIFPALMSDDQTLQQVGFAGQGWIDDLSITDQIPDFVKAKETFTITGGEHVESFQYNGKTWNNGDAPMMIILEGAPESVTGIVYEDGYFGDTTEMVVKVANQEYKVGNAKVLRATVTIDGTETKCETLAAAVDAVNAAKSDVTLKLGAPAAGITLANANANVTITIDLAGQTITQGEGDTAAIYVESGSVVVDDLVGGGTVQGHTDAGLVALVVSEGSATLNKGIYNGVVGGEGLAITSADVKILASANPDGVSATVPGGMELKEGPDGYLSLVASAPTKPETWEEVTDDTPMTDLPGVTAEVAGALTDAGVTVSAVKTWATGSGAVLTGAPINLDAFVMDAANAATPAELAAKAAAEITQEVLDAIVAAGTAADLSAIAKKYPNATVTVVPATELVSTDTAKFFKLKFELKVAQ